MQAVRDQRGFDFGEFHADRLDPVTRAVERGGGQDVQLAGLNHDHLFQVGALGVGIRRQAAPAGDGGREVRQAAVETRFGNRRRQVADDGRIAAALGNRRFGRIVGGVEIDVRQVAQEVVRPAITRQAGLFAWHEFQSAMRTEMHDGIRGEGFAQVGVVGREGVGRRKALFEEQAHRVAFIAEARLQADEHIAEPGAKHEERAAIRQHTAGRRAPGGFDIFQAALTADMIRHRNFGDDVGFGTVTVLVAFEQHVLEVIDRGRNLDAVTFSFEPLQEIEQRFEDRQVRGGADAAGVGGEVEQRDRKLAAGARGALQPHQLVDPCGELLGPLGAGLHASVVIGECATAGASGTRRAMVGAPADDNGSRRAVQFWKSDHDGRLDRRQPARIRAPVRQGLELRSQCADIGNIEGFQHLDGAVRIIEGGAADEREAGQGNKGVDGGRLAAHEVAADRGPGIEAAGKGGDDAQAARLEGGDDAVIMAGITGGDVGAQHEQADRRTIARRFRQRLQPLGHGGLHLRMVEPGLREFFRRQRIHLAAQVGARAGRITVDQEAHSVGNVLFRARQQVLHGHEIGAHVLGHAGNVAQDFRQAAQRLHLLLAGFGLVAGAAAQTFHQRNRAAGRLRHVEPVQPRQLYDFRGRHGANDGIKGIAARLQGRQHRLDMVLEEQHRGEDEIRLADILDGAGERLRLAIKFRGRMKGERQVRMRPAQFRLGGADGRAEMGIQRQDDDPDGRHVDQGCALSGHSSPLRHRGFRA